MKSKRKGVTLIELILTSAILGIILVPLSNLVLTTVKITAEGRSKQEATALAQKHMEYVKAKGNSILMDTPYSTDAEGEGPGKKYIVKYSLDPVDEYKLTYYDYDYILKVNNGIDENSTSIKFLDSKGDEVGSRLGNNLPTIEVITDDVVANEVSLEIKIDGNDFIKTSKVPASENSNLKLALEINKDFGEIRQLEIKASNKCDTKKLMFYFIQSKDIENKDDINLIEEEGSIVSYYNVSKEEMDYTVESRVYEVEVKVYKKDNLHKELISIKGYKTF